MAMSAAPGNLPKFSDATTTFVCVLVRTSRSTISGDVDPDHGSEGSSSPAPDSTGLRSVLIRDQQAVNFIEAAILHSGQGTGVDRGGHRAGPGLGVPDWRERPLVKVLATNVLSDPGMVGLPMNRAVRIILENSCYLAKSHESGDQCSASRQRRNLVMKLIGTGNQDVRKTEGRFAELASLPLFESPAEEAVERAGKGRETRQEANPWYWEGPLHRIAVLRDLWAWPQNQQPDAESMDRMGWKLAALLRNRASRVRGFVPKLQSNLLSKLATVK
ncbi:uncharacterized protein B0H64DRAFT_375950 [Chaetomium fimeti]|uniref:Uncharacterized protein n=1 Tax=Chaetomium fimeti TaxID=1854472 RepID=A0AAE0LPQ5_9PEZI|nr:hypothetical protein B0H64DRAFT_375950 [Chaetomium fimeti]